MNDQNIVTGIQKPDWAPDDCPPDVYKFVEDEQYLQDLGLRGLGSAHSKEFRQAVRKLREQLVAAYQAGGAAALDAYVPKPPIGAWIFGYLSGVLFGALAVYALFM